MTTKTRFSSLAAHQRIEPASDMRHPGDEVPVRYIVTPTGAIKRCPYPKGACSPLLTLEGELKPQMRAKGYVDADELDDPPGWMDVYLDPQRIAADAPMPDEWLPQLVRERVAAAAKLPEWTPPKLPRSAPTTVIRRTKADE